ncbi:MAG TPA: pitrilysin family protein [Pyrinomonadaceae bacterium]|nr:pitrilysin family protein [Pyrinomonadaceae bacterium]
MKPKVTKTPPRDAKTRAAALALCALLALLPLAEARGQSPSAPQAEKLLNGLRVLVSHRPGEPEVTLKLRVHSGAAFDLAVKEGTTALVGDALFADGSARDFVVGELKGRLEVSTGYDSVDVLMSGPAEEFERLAELLRNAVMGGQIKAETFTRLREARSQTLSALGVAPAAVADRAVAVRLYGAHPYGRAYGGTPESLTRVERGDVIHARERFLTPDNSTLVVVGGVEPRRAMRALRQYLGGWRKSDARVPATFRQPQTPDARTLVVERAGAPDAEIRLALRGLSRADSDAPAARVLALVAQERWLTAAPELKSRAAFVRHDAHALGGTFVMGASAPTESAAQSLDAARKVLRALASAPPTADEFARARSAAAAVLTKDAERPEAVADVWLDAQTYGPTANSADWARAINSLTPADVQRVAARLFANATPAAVAVGDSARLRVDLAPLGGVEVLGANADVRADAPAPAAPKQPAPLKRP